ncbi:hypothetical protein C7M84_009284 [Penaeus vannamei]|uniref:Uncharacterized protein n=1 Tax=Penaeus vannamei TaxID=6689 RepID=A0A3R7SRW4_PENVA|nr:hypothetical protein C7M84_009284 [Penaeus vannamei]
MSLGSLLSFVRLVSVRSHLLVVSHSLRSLISSGILSAHLSVVLGSFSILSFTCLVLSQFFLCSHLSFSWVCLCSCSLVRLDSVIVGCTLSFSFFRSISRFCILRAMVAQSSLSGVYFSSRCRVSLSHFSWVCGRSILLFSRHSSSVLQLRLCVRCMSSFAHHLALFSFIPLIAHNLSFSFSGGNRSAGSRSFCILRVVGAASFFRARAASFVLCRCDLLAQCVVQCLSRYSHSLYRSLLSCSCILFQLRRSSVRFSLLFTPLLHLSYSLSTPIRVIFLMSSHVVGPHFSFFISAALLSASSFLQFSPVFICSVVFSFRLHSLSRLFRASLCFSFLLSRGLSGFFVYFFSLSDASSLLCSVLFISLSLFSSFLFAHSLFLSSRQLLSSFVILWSLPLVCVSAIVSVITPSLLCLILFHSLFSFSSFVRLTLSFLILSTPLLLSHSLTHYFSFSFSHSLSVFSFSLGVTVSSLFLSRRTWRSSFVIPSGRSARLCSHSRIAALIARPCSADSLFPRGESRCLVLASSWVGCASGAWSHVFSGARLSVWDRSTLFHFSPILRCRVELFSWLSHSRALEPSLFGSIGVAATCRRFRRGSLAQLPRRCPQCLVAHCRASVFPFLSSFLSLFSSSSAHSLFLHSLGPSLFSHSRCVSGPSRFLFSFSASLLLCSYLISSLLFSLLILYPSLFFSSLLVLFSRSHFSLVRRASCLQLRLGVDVLAFSSFSFLLLPLSFVLFSCHLSPRSFLILSAPFVFLILMHSLLLFSHVLSLPLSSHLLAHVSLSAFSQLPLSFSILVTSLSLSHSLTPSLFLILSAPLLSFSFSHSSARSHILSLTLALILSLTLALILSLTLALILSTPHYALLNSLTQLSLLILSLTLLIPLFTHSLSFSYSLSLILSLTPRLSAFSSLLSHSLYYLFSALIISPSSHSSLHSLLSFSSPTALILFPTLSFSHSLTFSHSLFHFLTKFLILPLTLYFLLLHYLSHSLSSSLSLFSLSFSFSLPLFLLPFQILSISFWSIY